MALALFDSMPELIDDYMLPDQQPRAVIDSPELRLAGAVLAAAVDQLRDLRRTPAGCVQHRRPCFNQPHPGHRCYERRWFCDHCKARHALAGLERWFRSDDDTWPFGFVGLCVLMRLEPAAVRERLGL